MSTENGTVQQPGAGAAPGCDQDHESLHAINAYIPTRMHEEIRRMSKTECRSISKQTQVLIEEALRARKGKSAA
jgi:hypothetical protein